MDRNCSACDIKIDINNYKKNETVCKTCYNKNKNKRKNNKNTLPQKETCSSQHKSKIDNNNVIAHENHAYLIIGPRNLGKTYYMLRKIRKNR